MRYIVATILLLVLPISANPYLAVAGSSVAAAGGGGGTPTWVQDDGQSFDPFNSARAVSFTSSTTAGNTIVAIYKGSNPTTLVVTDTQSNTYNVHVDGSTSGIAIATALNIVGGANTVTFTVTSHANPGDIIVLEYSNIATSSAFDDGDQGGSTFEANRSITVGPLVQATELLIGVLAKGGGGVTAGSGFTLRHNQGNTYTEEKVSIATTAQAIDFVHAEATTQISVATFKGN